MDAFIYRGKLYNLRVVINKRYANTDWEFLCLLLEVYCWSQAWKQARGEKGEKKRKEENWWCEALCANISTVVMLVSSWIFDEHSSRIQPRSSVSPSVGSRRAGSSPLSLRDHQQVNIWMAQNLFFFNNLYIMWPSQILHQILVLDMTGETHPFLLCFSVLRVKTPNHNKNGCVSPVMPSTHIWCRFWVTGSHNVQVIEENMKTFHIN